jgi:uncharacterized protein (TIGR02996 family)
MRCNDRGAFMAKTLHRPAQRTGKTADRKKRAARRQPEVLKSTPAAAQVGEALRLAIWKDPRDRDSLRVYADWLAEQGSTRGQYIQLCCLDKPTAEQRRAAERLLKRDRGKWLGEARRFALCWWDSKNPPGFVSRIFCQPAQLVEGFEPISRLGPRLIVSVISLLPHRRKNEAELARLALGDLWGLSFSAGDVDDSTLATLAPAMRGLRWLEIHHNDVTGEGLAALGAKVDTLQYLSLAPLIAHQREARKRMVDSCARAVVSTPGLRSLVHLHFRGVSPSDEWCRRLTKLPHLQKLNTELKPPEIDSGP